MMQSSCLATTRWNSLLALFVVYSSSLVSLGYGCPQMCQCRQSFYVYCDNINITESQLDAIIQNIPPTVHYLDLSHNLLTSVPHTDTLDNLRQLNLAYNCIGELNVPGLRKLRMLDLKKNRVSRLARNALSSLHNLQELHLENNGIKTIVANSLDKLVNLRKLHLQRNYLTTLRKGELSELRSIEDLDLSNNEIKFIGDSAFSGLENLSKLRLKNNKLSAIKPLTFLGLSKLTEINLDFNGVKDLNGNDFASSRNGLRVISLNGNKIEALNSSYFGIYKQLKRISLDDNHIFRITSGTFKGLNGLRELSLKGNLIRVVDRKMFKGPNSLSQLNLQENSIRKISTGAFDSFRESIYEINLGGNKLENLKRGMFRRMKYIQKMDLKRNQISDIEIGALRDMKALLDLDLSDNKLKYINPDMLRGLTSLRQLYLHGNPLVELRGVKFYSNSVLKHVTFNLTVDNVTKVSVDVRWPYRGGNQIYWSVFVTCLSKASPCKFPRQPQNLPAYRTDVRVENLRPSSSYYICVNPTFVSATVVLEQCLIVNTPPFRTTQQGAATSTSSLSSDCISNRVTRPLMLVYWLIITCVYSLNYRTT